MSRLSSYLTAVLLAFGMALPAVADTTMTIDSRHELRIGFADAFAPAASLRSVINGRRPSRQPEGLVGMPVGEADAYLKQYSWYTSNHECTTGHFFLGYQYRLTPLVSLGVDLDMSKMGATSTVYNGYGTQKGTLKNHVYIWSVLPTVRLTYLEHPHVRLYSSLGMGYTCYAGEWNRKDIMQNGVGLNVTLLGVQAGGEHVFGAVGLGAYNAWYFSSKGTEWMPFSRILSASIGCRF